MSDDSARQKAESHGLAPASGGNVGPGLAVAAIVLAVDQAMKWIVTYSLHLQQREVVKLQPFFNLRWEENRGVSMNLLNGDSEAGRWLLVALTAAICSGVALWLWRAKRREEAIALGIVLGGALGNIADRVRYGFVVDYADLHFGAWRPFLIFNIADAAITIGILLLLVSAFLKRERKRA
jgi:signal peptidase II